MALEGLKDREIKLELLTEKAESLSNFLYHYLPLLNAHNSDFITLEHWTKLIDPDIASELLSLSDEHLAKLPCGNLADCGIKGCSDSKDDKSSQGWRQYTKKHYEESLMFYQETNIASSSTKPVWEQVSQPKWIHSSLAHLIQECRLQCLPGLSVLTDSADLRKYLGLSKCGDTVLVKNFMSCKKSHEVHIMADLCSDLAQAFSTNRVLDIGSGKGYLGCQLSLMYDLRVLGVDSCDINTTSAQQRKQRLEKHWKALLRNAQEGRTKGPRSKRSKGEARKSDDHVEKSMVDREPNEEWADHLGSVFEEDVKEGVDESNELMPADKDKADRSISFKSDSVQRVNDVDKTCFKDDNKPQGPATGTVTHKKLKRSITKTNYVPITKFITDSTDIMELVHEHFPDLQNSIDTLERDTRHSAHLACTEEAKEVISTGRGPLLLTGLHTCGNLGSALMQLFAESQDVGVLCNVGCCYHLIEEEFIRNPLLKPDEPDPTEEGYPISTYLQHRCAQLGRNARMLAAQPPDRLVEGEKLPSQSLYWRALLQVMLRDAVGEVRSDWHVGRIANKCADFKDYVHKCLDKLGMDSNTFSAADIERYQETYAAQEHQLTVFFQLKAMFAPCIEALILIDRVLYLLEQPQLCDVHLVQLFDPVTSPRCYAIVAWKDASTTH